MMKFRCPFLLICFFSGITRLAFSDPMETVHVTGKMLSVNGATEVPIGLFGVHATPLTPEIVADWRIESVRTIDHNPSGKPQIAGTNPKVPTGVKHIVECFFDRYQPAKVLLSKTWKEELEKLARSYAENAKTTGQTHYIEFWNEPFLNWATKPGVNYDPVYYETANQAEGAPMTIKGWEKPLDYLVWSKKLIGVEAESGAMNYLGASYAPRGKIKDGDVERDVREGDTYDFRGKKMKMVEMWWGKDPTQKSYWSGKQNAQFYNWMFGAFSQALKEVNPKVQVVGGWGFHIFQGDWEAWETLFKPLIDEHHQRLDGIGEHHYGEDTRAVAGSYEMVAAYAQARYGKELKFYNTEAGGQLDPQRPDTIVSQFAGNTIEAQSGAMTYGIRDIVHLIATCPDKAVARATHSPEQNAGNEFSFKMLKGLRGRLIQTTTPRPDLWCVASLDGATMTTIVFNDNRAAQKIPVTIEAPAGMKFTGGKSMRVVVRDNQLAAVEAPFEAYGGMWSESVDFPPKSAVKWTFDVSGSAPTKPQVMQTQFYASSKAHPESPVLHRLKPGGSVELEIVIPEARLAAANDAHLKIVQQGFDPRTGSLKFNGQEIDLAKNSNTWIREYQVDSKKLKPKNTLVFSCKKESATGFVINAASLVVVEEK